MLAVTWLFGFTTVVGLVLTVYYGRKSAKLELARKKLEWYDLQACANDMGAEIKRTFTPDLLLTPGLSGATFANLLLYEFNREIPVFVGVRSWKLGTGAFSCCGKFLVIETTKWYVHIPDCILDYKDKKILVVDDFAMSGDFLESIKRLLVSNGFEAGNIKTATMVATKVAIHNRKAPDFFWMQTPDDSFFFPWGRAR